MSSPTDAPPRRPCGSPPRRFGTPLFVTDLADPRRRLRGRAATRFRIRSSASTRSRPTTCRRSSPPSAARGFGANVVSRGEWSLARRAGIPNDRITLEGIGKTTADLARGGPGRGVGDPLRWVAIESPEEAAALAAAVRRAGAATLDVLYRLNPDVAPETHAGLAVGGGATKFGMTETEIGAAIAAGGGPDGPLRPRGIHLHVGSQLGAVDAWRDAVRKALALAALWRGSIETFDTVDLGGGFPVRPTASRRPTRRASPGSCRPLLDGVPADRRPTRLAIEPGRWLVARAGWLVARVLHVRDRGGPQVVLDAGHDRAHPAGAVRGPPPDPRPDLARAASPGPGDRSPTRVEGPDLRVHRRAGHPRPAAAAARRPRGHRRCGRLRGLARIDLQRPATAAAGAPRADGALTPRARPRSPMSEPRSVADARLRYAACHLAGPSASGAPSPAFGSLAVLAALAPPAVLAAGPPFPDPIADQAVYDTADALEAQTRANAELIADSIEQQSRTQIVVYTQRIDAARRGRRRRRGAQACWPNGSVGGPDAAGMVILADLEPERHDRRRGQSSRAPGFEPFVDAEELAAIRSAMDPWLDDGDLDTAIFVALAETSARRSIPADAPGVQGSGPLTDLPAPGPPFPNPIDGQAVYDFAGILSPEAEVAAERTIDAIEDADRGRARRLHPAGRLRRDDRRDRDAAPGRSSTSGASGVPGFDDGLAIFFDIDPSLEHGQVQLYAAPGFEATYLTNSERQRIFDEDMVPLLRATDFDGALAVAP